MLQRMKELRNTRIGGKDQVVQGAKHVDDALIALDSDFDKPIIIGGKNGIETEKQKSGGAYVYVPGSGQFEAQEGRKMLLGSTALCHMMQIKHNAIKGIMIKIDEFWKKNEVDLSNVGK